MRVLLHRRPEAQPQSSMAHYAAQLELTLRLQLTRDDRLVARPGVWAERMAHVFGASGRRLSEAWFRASARHGGFDLYHETATLAVPSSRPTVTTVHGLAPLLNPAWYPTSLVRAFERHWPQTAASSHCLIVPSLAGKKELIAEGGVAADRVRVIPFGIRPAFRPLSRATLAAALRRLELPPHYYLAIGPAERRKNLLTLARAYCCLPLPIRHAVPLVLVGAHGSDRELLTFLADRGCAEGIRIMPYLGDADLSAVYQGSLGLCVPSFATSFGLAAAEMRACGGAVLASTAPALVEQLGDHASYIDPHDEPGWHDALLRLATDDAWREQLRANENVAPLTWLGCAEATWGLYREVLGIETGRRPFRRAA